MCRRKAVLLGGHDPSGHGPYLLTGPEVLSRAEQVERLGAALGRRLRFAAVPADAARARSFTEWAFDHAAEFVV
ncbi:hypothetical protein ACFYYL_07785 [Actinomadura geliboluensis]|uniref:hypothetical protein n=1 Tax=Actinomadura geliboluensis TaxID=882440 RepID=UPI00367F03D5